MNQVRKCMNNSFHETRPPSRKQVSLSIVDDMILKINDNDFENIIDNLHDVREKILHMIGLQRFVRQVVDKVRDDDNVIK